MDLTPFVSPDPATRQPALSDCPADSRRGWSAERKLRFLDRLAARGNVRAACAAVGLSRDSAYTLRRRDALFARGWAAALELARERSAEVLADKATEGIEEEVWYRGELVGTRRRFDARLLLAHMARLDRMAEETEGHAAADAARFDELLACIAGVEIPEELQDAEDPLPLHRDCAIEEAEEEVRAAVDAAWTERLAASDDDLADEEHAAYLHERETETASARAEAAARRDTWFESACRSVDDLLGRGAAGEQEASVSSSRTVSDVSGSAP